MRLLPSLSDVAPNAPSRASHSSSSSPSWGVSESQSARPGEGDVVLRVTERERQVIAAALDVAEIIQGELGDRNTIRELREMVLAAGPFTPARAQPGCICNARDEWVTDSCPVHGGSAA